MAYANSIKTYFFMIIAATMVMTCVGWSGQKSAEAASVVLENKAVPFSTNTFSLELRLEATTTEQISAFDITIQYDQAKMILNSIVPTLNLQASGKTLNWNEKQIGRVRIVVYGTNSTSINAGNVITLNYSKVSGVPIGPVTVTLSGTHGATVLAQPIALSVVNNPVIYEGLPPDVPSILNTDTILNTNQFTLRWTDESASGAVGYVVTRIQTLAPLKFSAGVESYWPLDEASGVAYDDVGSNPLREVNGVPGTNDKPFNMLPGSRNFRKQYKASLIASYQDQYGWIDRPQMTWSAWIKPRTIGSTMAIVDQWNIPGAIQRYYDLSITNTGQLQASVSSDGKIQKVCTSAAGVIKAGVWQHVAMGMNINSGTNKPFADVTQKNTVTSFGSVAIDNADFKVFPSAALNSTSSGFTVPANTNLAFSTSAFTIDFWVKLDTLNSDSYTYLMGQYKTSSQYMELRYSNSSKYLMFQWRNATSDYGAYFKGANISLSKGQWYHIAIVRAGSGNNYSLFVNGVKKTIAYSATSNSCNYISAPLYIGCNSSGAYGFKGKLDQVRITKGVARWSTNFDPTQVDTRYQSNNILFIPFSAETMVKLYVDGKDVSTALIENTVTPLVTVSDKLRIGSQAGNSNYFDGLIADVACWERVLAIDDVNALAWANKEVLTAQSTTLQQSSLQDALYVYFAQAVNAKGTLSDFSVGYDIEIAT
jgi:hypothetical protein